MSVWWTKYHFHITMVLQQSGSQRNAIIETNADFGKISQLNNLSKDSQVDSEEASMYGSFTLYQVIVLYEWGINLDN